ncbi:MAG: hypothetical protein A3C02_04830 [Candidatus Andersenbacteria bacterium RIFCSPHIGHO2_02_FULL_45_11]|uniref:Uncharacterized protein n=1 Tax=Candidatus Andersenbacteria bacterium RIFCSPHIGHO2_12_FULL_45_11 TaxID=1797281 RepID=A0A1G1X252_9BACT|nr:MAG: hypothetical protein A2805_00920 [Candidatus Andersenbacteria bacterium RIFCSPHIGHO2_01_FULL_46_36]OGY31934.1 MAG: hypothetical protein A3C02_04830 [Candidatus Andersenbacteria bacterium RIFCSPHIGHO2_02_FULL_45_11]OGY33640.1 MAG: hypothetical protein A3D99_03775 [Candidatus Andersenbacteria bacterium RIFCSPHIGHO2_12_FULL_45_11]
MYIRLLFFLGLFGAAVPSLAFAGTVSSVDNFTITVYYTAGDSTAPTVSTLSPTDNATAVATSSNLVITFDEAVDVETGNITIKKTSDDSTVEAIDVTGGLVTGTGTDTITVNPTADLDEETEYYVLIDATAFDDTSSNSYAGISSTTAWSFTTADETAPTITNVSSDKANSSYTTGEVIDIDVTFSEAVTSTGNVTVTLETGDTDRTCTFTVSSSTTGTCNYTVEAGDTTSDLTVSTISGTIDDASSNAMSNFVPTTNLAANKALVIDTTAPDAPTATPTGATFTSTQSVTLTSSGNTIYYTIDGTTPTTGSTTYSAAITVAATTTIKAIAVDTVGNESSVMSESYVISIASTSSSSSSSSGSSSGTTATQSSISLDQATINKKTKKSEISTRTNSVFKFSSKIPDADQVKVVTLKIFGKTYKVALKQDGTFTLPLMTIATPGKYTYKLNADYGSFNLNSTGTIIVEKPKPARTLTPSINHLFRLANDRNPSFSEWLYWATRILKGDKKTLPELFGAMQWQAAQR